MTDAHRATVLITGATSGLGRALASQLTGCAEADHPDLPLDEVDATRSTGVSAETPVPTASVAGDSVLTDRARVVTEALVCPRPSASNSIEHS